MSIDAIDTEDFYRAPLGRAVARLVAARVARLWGPARGLRVLLVGCGPPAAGGAADGAERTVALLLAHAGAPRRPAAPPGRALVAHEAEFPLPDNFFDRVLLLHALEAADSARALLRETWRVMAPEGRLVAVAPNRRGLWARIERTPFGHGRPYSAGQLAALLRDAAFHPQPPSSLLHAPPLPGRLFARVAPAWERVARRWGSPFGGLVAAEAGKRVHIPPAEAAPARRIRAYRPAAERRAYAAGPRESTNTACSTRRSPRPAARSRRGRPRRSSA